MLCSNLKYTISKNGTLIRGLLRTCCVRVKENMSFLKKNQICDWFRSKQMPLTDQIIETMHQFLNNNLKSIKA